MPVHDWNRVIAGVFHDFHHSWIEEIKRALNGGILPADYYALAALEREDSPDSSAEPGNARSATLARPPKAYFTATTKMQFYVAKQKSVVIHHASDDRVVALVEIVSPGNKAGRRPLRAFIEKATESLFRGLHLLILDLHPPGTLDPQGIHGAIWEEIADHSYRAPADKPLTLVAYSSGPVKTCYVEPVAVGDVLPDMPLFLEPDACVYVPLEATYQAAWREVPRRWQQVLLSDEQRGND
ncbi:MAG TPA: hypothetical protein VGX78_07470 [Pirellulales bacterium]|nr:hypothetical protein [Pirellulales bacterium]